ncbi:poly(ADP-ribose) glycohydrolase isoform X2 [Prorops nasuta]|uniref:poly(ADP-ribose) glycohydrolase isoform X2 n=1 Tax=Prorops nasuta TaxID=863751 RepID=UPI0034CD6423
MIRQLNGTIANIAAASSSCSEVNDKNSSNSDNPSWEGVSMTDIHNGSYAFNNWKYPPIFSSREHIVLFKLPFHGNGPPKPFPSYLVDKWDNNHVQMPHSQHNQYSKNQETEYNTHQSNWALIEQSLMRRIMSSHELETAILSYNCMFTQRWDFTALHHFFSQILDQDEKQLFFEGLLPKMISLALQLPILVTGSIPLLKRHTNRCISISQLQVSSILANAFFCTFPREYSASSYSDCSKFQNINFNRLFSAFRRDKHNRNNAVMEKLKCLFHYFRRVTTKAPEGVITIERRYIPHASCPQWEKQNQKLPPLHITSAGTIETDGAGLLQVDFANKNIGGGVLRTGCVQEEIRFVVCPELITSMLVSETLDDTEVIIITGIERYSKYEGYGNDFKWAGNFVDDTPFDSSNRRMTSVVAMDALRFDQPTKQFEPSNIVRELNKAYVGFSGTQTQNNDLPGVATGNWGCGAFRGNPRLKVLIQLMAAAISNRPVVYFTFGDIKLQSEAAAMYWRLIQYNIDVGQLFSLLMNFRVSPKDKNPDLYRFLSSQIYLPKATFSKQSQQPHRSDNKVTISQIENDELKEEKMETDERNEASELMKVTERIETKPLFVEKKTKTSLLNYISKDETSNSSFQVGVEQSQFNSKNSISTEKDNRIKGRQRNMEEFLVKLS